MGATGERVKSVRFACGLLVVVSFLAYAPVWSAYFLADDFAYTKLYAQRPISEWAQVAAGDWTRGVWGFRMDELRSVMGLAFWSDGKLWPVEPAGYHFTNLLFHAACSILVFLLARALVGSGFVPLLAGLLFSLHPAHSEAVSWISGRADPMCACFSLASLLAFVQYRVRGRRLLYAWSLAAFVLALFSKEIAMTFPLLPLGYDLFRDKKPAERWRHLWRAHAGFGGLLAAYALLRSTVFAHPIRANALTPAVLREFAVRQITYLKFLAAGPGVENDAIWAAALVVFVIVVWRRAPWRRTLLFLGPWWFVAGVIPLIVTYASARHLYLTSAGACLLLAAGLATLAPRRLFAASAIAVLSMFGFLLVRQNLRWSDAARISRSAQAAIAELARSLPPNAGLILDVPAGRDGAYLWLSSLPMALDPPFIAGGVYEKLRVVEKPVTYRYWAGADGAGKTWLQDRRPVIEDLAANPADCYYIGLNEAGEVMTAQFAAAEVKATLTPLVELVDARNPYDSVFTLDAQWDSFWKRALMERGGRITRAAQ